jgi:hypothetical protein
MKENKPEEDHLLNTFYTRSFSKTSKDLRRKFFIWDLLSQGAIILALLIAIPFFVSTLAVSRTGSSMSEVVNSVFSRYNWYPFMTIPMLVAFATLKYRSFYRNEIELEIQNGFEEKVENEPENIKPVWDLARVTLERYFNRNLGQITAIFWLSVMVLILGFFIIVIGIFIALTQNAKVEIALISAISGIITEFIGATFLFIYRSTISQAVYYTKTLDRINSVGMSISILSTIGDEVGEKNLKDLTKTKLVMMLMGKSYQENLNHIEENHEEGGKV